MSIMRQMKDKAVAMAEAMAERARSPQDIEAARQRLVAEIQGGRVPAYVGVPLVQDLTQRLTQAKAQMAQQVAGMGVPQAPQGAPIAQQVMAQAQPAAGVEALPSNLPTSYAPGGLVAFEEGGPVERYANQGLVPGVPSWLQGLYSNESPAERARRERLEADAVAQAQARGALPPTPIGNFTRPGMGNDPRVLGAIPPEEGVGINAERARNMAIVNAPPVPKPGAGTAPGVAMPKLNLPAAPALTDYSFLKQLPKESQEASEKAITAKKKELEDIDNPLFKAREERLTGREAAIDKDSAIGRALNLMSLGFGIAGSEKRTLAGALSDSRQGIADLIKGEAANRAAKERLEDLRDNLTQQRAAAQKGNAAAAEAAGQRVSDDLYKAANLNATAMHYGNTEALQRYQTNQQGVLGLAQLQQQAAATNASLQLGRERNALLEKHYTNEAERNRTAMATAIGKAGQAYDASPAGRALMIDLQKRWGSLQHPKAQAELLQARNQFIQNSYGAFMPSASSGANAKDALELIYGGQQ